LKWTAVQIDAVKSRVRHDPRVAGFQFWSRAQALADLRKKFPLLVANLPKGMNPMGARIEIELRPGVNRADFVARYTAMKLRGVATVLGC
jgi:cell division protein FtsX